MELRTLCARTSLYNCTKRKTWPAAATSALQDCFEKTEWHMFREAATHGNSTNLEEYTALVISYISKCIDDVTIAAWSNQRPWMAAEVPAQLRTQDTAFRKGNVLALRAARPKLSRAIRIAKWTQRIHGHFQDSSDTRHMWQGIQTITNNGTTSAAFDSDTSLPGALNSFYDVVTRRTTPSPGNQVLCLTTADVRNTLRRADTKKGAGPGNIPGHVLRECADANI